jgi:predicted alpha/beta superfamily hydrolase
MTIEELREQIDRVIPGHALGGKIGQYQFLANSVLFGHAVTISGGIGHKAACRLVSSDEG